MYQYIWDTETGGLLLTSDLSKFSKEPRPVYYRELDTLGFDRYWTYPRDDRAPIMWAEANNYIYKGRTIAKTKGGSLYTAPELIVLDDSDCNNELEFVDIDTMVERNRKLLETLVQESIQKVYNAYRRYRKKVDMFHVSFSGGKDSVVTLDIVQRAIPHNDFVVLFGNTGMEFPDTLDVVEKIKEQCINNDIKFYVAKSDYDALQNWEVFGPPSNTIRWCCSVHKTTPQLLCLRDIIGKNDLIEMAFVGIRADESIKRSEYDYISLGTKHKGQYSCNPIIDWSSAEIYLYIFAQKLIINEAYKKGNSRAGCLVCPMAKDKSEFIRRQCYPDDVDRFIDAIKATNGREFPSESDTHHFIDVGGWKVRNNGRDLKNIPIKYVENSATTFEIIDPSQDWTEWLKTLGSYVVNGTECILQYQGNTYSFTIESFEDKIIVTVTEDLVKNYATLVKNLKQVFRKAAYCVACRECQADCPHGCLNFIDGKIKICDSCKHCLNCHKPAGGCLLFQSIEQPKGNGKMNTKAIDCYADHAPKIEWIQSFFELKNDFVNNHTLGSVMISMFKRFLRDAELIEDNRMTETAEILSVIGDSNPAFWAIMLVNLSHTAEIGWYIHNVPFDTMIQKDYLIELLKASGAKDRGAKSVSGAYRRILALPFGDMLGLGSVTPEKRSFYIVRGHWSNPVPEVILYSLYKFAEACGDYYQFTLETLLDDSIERDGVSPTRIFGLDRETMIPILNGLSVNYQDFISASFTLDLDNITLNPEKTSADVLQIFKEGQP